MDIARAWVPRPLQNLPITWRSSNTPRFGGRVPLPFSTKTLMIKQLHSVDYLDSQTFVKYIDSTWYLMLLFALSVYIIVANALVVAIAIVAVVTVTNEGSF